MSAQLLPVDIDERLRAVALEQPNAPAVKDARRTLTWGEFDARISRVANALLARGVEPEDRVAILGRNSVAYLEVFFGCLRAGGCVVPLSALSSDETLSGMLEDSGARLLFVGEEFAAPMLSRGARLARLRCGNVFTLDGRSAGIGTIEDFIAGAPSDHPALESDPSWAFNLIYSSGTTMAPKGIVQDRRFRAQEATDMAVAFAFDASMRTLVSTPLYSNTTLFFLVSTLAAGGCAILMEKFEAREFLRLCVKESVTHAVLVPVQFTRLLAEPTFESFDLSTFRGKFCTSAPLHASVKREVMERWPHGGLVEFYGMTEGGVNCTLFAHERPDKLDTVGLPAPDCDLRILDDAGRQLPPGAIGEIVGHGPKMMTGYFKQDAATRAAIWHDAEGRPFQRSGDLGWLDEEGFLHLLDRKKDMIISGGFNVYAIDLERALLQHPQVVEAAVIGVPSERWGETPVAVVVVAPGSSVNPDALRSWANARLGKAQRISEIRLVPSLPRNAIGKVLKRQLRDGFTVAAVDSPGAP